MSGTIEHLHEENLDRRNVFVNFFQSITDGFGKLCGCTKPLQESQRTSARNGEVFQINIGEECAQNLRKKFSDPTFDLPTDFQPIIEIPIALGKQLYSAYVESIYQQQEAHNQLVKRLIKEDEEFARRLQDEENRYEEAAAVKPKPSKQIELIPKSKNFVEYPAVHRGRDTSTSKDLVSGLLNQHKKPYVEQRVTTFETEDETVDESDYVFQRFDERASLYRVKAQEHFKKRKQFYQKAKQCLKANNRQRANYYFQQAREQTKLYEEANSMAAAAFLSENHDKNPRKDTIDLHRLYVKEAIQALDVFLDEQIVSLKDERLQSKSIMVVTGRGKHSVDGIPKIKPAVIGRLRQRGLTYYQVNPGLFRVHIFEHSYLTHEL